MLFNLFVSCEDCPDDGGGGIWARRWWPCSRSCLHLLVARVVEDSGAENVGLGSLMMSLFDKYLSKTCDYNQQTKIAILRSRKVSLEVLPS